MILRSTSRNKIALDSVVNCAIWPFSVFNLAASLSRNLKRVNFCLEDVVYLLRFDLNFFGIGGCGFNVFSSIACTMSWMKKKHYLIILRVYEFFSQALLSFNMLKVTYF